MQKAVHNAATGEVVVIDMSPEETAELEAFFAKVEAAEAGRVAQQQAYDAAKTKLEGLGLTVEELKLLLST